MRSIGLTVYGNAIPRGYDAEYIVVCQHRGPGFLNWDWSQNGATVLVEVRLVSGFCKPGPKVAGKGVKVTLTIRS